MAGRRGPKISTFMRERIYQIEAKWRADHLRKPNAPQVHWELERYMEARNLPDQIPGQSAIAKILARSPLKTLGPDAPWSLGAQIDPPIPDDAINAIMTVWEYSITSGLELPFTISIARWVSKLRYLERAGGSVTGVVQDPELLYNWAGAYAARERVVTVLRPKEKGMQTGVMDASLFFDPTLFRVVRSQGFLEDDEGIDYAEEFAQHYADLYRYYILGNKFKEGIAKHQEELDEGIHELADLIEETPFVIPEDRTLVYKLISVSMASLLRDKRARKLTAAETGACTLEVARSVITAYKAGTLTLWEPPIKELKKKFLRGKSE
jgi:hypothetical protein